MAVAGEAAVGGDFGHRPVGRGEEPLDALDPLPEDRLADGGAELGAEALVEVAAGAARRAGDLGNGDAARGGPSDLVNAPKQVAFAPVSYWDIQRRAAEAIREIDPATPIVVESNISASPTSFAYLRPLPMDNVIYQLHLYAPGDYTHQGVGRALKKDGRPLVWPDPSRGWDFEYLRRVLEPVRDFQRRHGVRIYVGEFSAVVWAPGADAYLRDCISLFEEYGWDWTYHAFREWGPWSVEHETAAPGRPSVPAADTPRKRALLEGLGLGIASASAAP